MSNLLPPSATITEINLDESFSRIEGVPTPARTTVDPVNAPAQILPWMAWAASVDDWDITWTDEQKRSVIAASFNVHLYKGTIGAVKAALGALGYEVQIQEWFNQIPQGEPYTFKIYVNVDQVGVSVEEFNRLRSIIENAKNLRSHLDKTQLTVSSESKLYCAATVLTGCEIEYTVPAGALVLDGTWMLNGSEILDGIKVF